MPKILIAANEENGFACEKKQKKFLLICGNSQTVITFRLGLIKALQKKGYAVSVVALDNDYKDEIAAQNIDFYSICVQNRSLNPFGMQKLKKNYRALIERLKPDVVFTFMLKPNIFGVRAAKKCQIKQIFSMVEGAGDVFANNGIKWKIIRSVVCKMYRRSFRHVKKIFFLNTDDKKEFVLRKIVKEEQCIVISGIGVDTERFTYRPIKNYNTFLMIARMLKTKGVLEYCKAARIVKEKYPDAVFNYLGAEGNIKVEDIQEYIDDGTLKYLGTTKDVRPYLEECAVFVLPSSYREGLPMSIMEAEAVGRMVITYNVIGCREAIEDKYNGFLVEAGNYEALSQKFIWCLEHGEEVALFGKNSRLLAEKRFAKDIINNKILDTIEEKGDV